MLLCVSSRKKEVPKDNALKRFGFELKQRFPVILPLSNAILLILIVRDYTSTVQHSQFRPPRFESQHTPLRRDSLEITEADTRNARHLTTHETRARVMRARPRPRAHGQKAVGVRHAVRPLAASASAITVRAS